MFFIGFAVPWFPLFKVSKFHKIASHGVKFCVRLFEEWLQLSNGILLGHASILGQLLDCLDDSGI
jgi:hypothetical protein